MYMYGSIKLKFYPCHNNTCTLIINVYLLTIGDDNDTSDASSKLSI